MTELIIIILSIALLLYVLLGGADFGAGIIETFSGKKGIDIISKAIAPIWEANHVWIILVVVIVFNGFPAVYTTISTFLHIPLLIILLGIVLRGSAFTFRYYDVIKDKSFTWYTFLFRASSFITPFFYGVVLGAIMLGKIQGEVTGGTFYDNFIDPWFNWFCVSTGIFTTLLFGWLASIYTTGETKSENERSVFIRMSDILLILLILSGVGVFFIAELYEVHFFYEFISSPVSISCVILATVLVPFIFRSIRKKQVTLSRLLAGLTTASIITGWYAIQFPVMVYLSGIDNLTIYNSRAPESTMVMLFWALVVGFLIIFPSIGYLMKVFKLNGKNKVTYR
ncbi:MAG TPA: cytochrome d ubiquinol oxidase subunit II [Lentimicrobium sp.]|nr:cytochrome d ubiquinol oxidase subunit II [Lentimicrobium sp.]